MAKLTSEKIKWCIVISLFYFTNLDNLSSHLNSFTGKPFYKSNHCLVRLESNLIVSQFIVTFLLVRNSLK